MELNVFGCVPAVLDLCFNKYIGRYIYFIRHVAVVVGCLRAVSAHVCCLVHGSFLRGRFCVGAAQLVGCALVFVQGERCGSHLAGDGHGMLRVFGDFGELRLIFLVVSLSVAQGYRCSRGWLDARCVGKLHFLKFD